jgi:hypothetical protein
MAREAIHRGEHLAEQLEALEMSAAEVARQLKVPTNRITHILNGQRAITGPGKQLVTTVTKPASPHTPPANLPGVSVSRCLDLS